MIIQRATTIVEFKTIEALAWEILPKHYAPYLPDAHTRFFLQKYQTLQKIEEQVANGFQYYLLVYNDKNVGYLGIDILANTLILSKLYILKAYRGKGLGKLAMQEVEKVAQQTQVNQIDLIVNRLNKATIQFYQSKGFIISEDLVHHYENGVSVEDYKMTKQL
ncbi:MAG: GNAT family N-acetyltransferase [Aureispira sp.]|nr:GNAT family N-acetyltransferase [Aureispira sp.]